VPLGRKIERFQKAREGHRRPDYRRPGNPASAARH
jgi:hypothetical protein